MSNIFYDKAEELVSKVGSRDPLEALAYLNTEVRYSNHHQFDGMKGFCIIALKQRYVMLNAKLSKCEMRCVASHELGHIKMHMKDTKTCAFQEFDLYHTVSLQEDEASSFGADFLMSDLDVLDVIENGCTDIYQAAMVLKVPRQFLTYKLSSMIARGHDLLLPELTDNRFLAKPLFSR